LSDSGIVAVVHMGSIARRLCCTPYITWVTFYVESTRVGTLIVATIYLQLIQN